MFYFPEPPVHPTNDGWENKLINPPSGIAHCPDNPLPPPPPLQAMPHVASIASMAQSIQFSINYKVLLIELQIDKENNQPTNQAQRHPNPLPYIPSNLQPKKIVMREKLLSMICILR
jgi:hypothetical protein